MEGGRGGPAELHVAPIQKPAMEFPSLLAERAPSDQAIPDAQIKKANCEHPGASGVA